MSGKSNEINEKNLAKLVEEAKKKHLPLMLTPSDRKKVPLPLSIERAWKDLLQEEADEQGRSLNNYCTQILKTRYLPKK